MMLRRYFYPHLPALHHEDLKAAEMAELLDGMLKGLGLKFPRLEKFRLRARERFPRTCVPDTEATRKTIWRHYSSAIARERSPWLHDLLEYLARESAWPRLESHVNRGQMSSKIWLVQELVKVWPNPGQVLVLGGWYGALASLLHEQPGLKVGKVVNVDLDAEAVAASLRLQSALAKRGLYEAHQGDMLALDFSRPPGGIPDTLVNTSCEHLPDFAGWYAKVPPGTFVVLQSNDYFAEPEHCNCVPDIAAFRQQAPLARELYAGTQFAPHGKYRRFMLMGFK